MKKIIGTLLLAVGLLSCSSCTKKPGPEPTPPTPIVDAGAEVEASPVPQMEVVIGDTWNFTLPNRNWHAEPVSEQITAYANDVDKNLILFAKEPFEGSTQQYALLAVRSHKDNGGTLVASKPVVIENVNFIFIELAKNNDPHVWAWLTVKNSFGYSFVCGGLETDDNFQRTLCESVARTMQLK